MMEVFLLQVPFEGCLPIAFSTYELAQRYGDLLPYTGTFYEVIGVTVDFGQIDYSRV